MPRTKLFSVTIDDCRVDTFTVGGHGGAGKDTSNTGVRVVHEPSGASGIARDSRRQSENKRTAFRRMAMSNEFRHWCQQQAWILSGQRPIDEVVDEEMEPKNLRVEVRDADGHWTEVED